jgi:hypothetical protein
MEWQLPWITNKHSNAGAFKHGVWVLTSQQQYIDAIADSWHVKRLSTLWTSSHKDSLNYSINTTQQQCVIGDLNDFPRTSMGNKHTAKHRAVWLVHHPEHHPVLAWDVFLADKNIPFATRSLAQSLINFLTPGKCDEKSVKQTLQWYCLARAQLNIVLASGLPCTLEIFTNNKIKLSREHFTGLTTPTGTVPTKPSFQTPAGMPLILRQILTDFWATLLQLQSRPSRLGEWCRADAHSRGLFKTLVIAQLHSTQQQHRPCTSTSVTPQSKREETTHPKSRLIQVDNQHLNPPMADLYV